MFDEALRHRLLEMADDDRRVRDESAARGELYDGYAVAMADVHRRNADHLRTILAEYGWPGTSLVGEDGSAAAWLIVQHAIGDPNLQRQCLPVLKAAAAAGEAEWAQVAYLEDRICFYERRPQRYGTQFDWDETGYMNAWVLEDAERVDEYRRSVGLGPLAQRLEQVRRETADERAPDDPKARNEAMMRWARSVGWL